jgi:predicted hotdog family 3-hydroxylacyl-ACP dehydratase
MLDRPGIAALIPHQGAMCLLDAVTAWDQSGIACQARSHLEPGNPLRQDGRLGAACGIEYGLQAAALHGALRSGASQPAGFLASLRGVTLHVDRLDNPVFGVLQITARSEGSDASGQAYAFRLAAESGETLVEGRCLIALPRPISAGDSAGEGI